MKCKLPTIFAALSSLLIAHFSLADVTPVGYWRLGESDAGASPDHAVSVSKDSAGNTDLTAVGGPVYSKEAAKGAALKNGSNLSVTFDTTTCLSADPVTVETDNFGIEAWVQNTGPLEGSGFIVNNGQGAPGTGFGLLRVDDQYQGIYSGNTFIFNPESPVKVTEEWTHLAIVRDSTTFGTNFYVNGKLVFSTGSPGPNIVPLDKATEPQFTIGSCSTGKDGNGFVAHNGFVGNIDEVRVFTFAPGTFDSHDLLFFSGNPSKAK